MAHLHRTVICIDSRSRSRATRSARQQQIHRPAFVFNPSGNTSGRNPKQRRPASSRQASTRLHPSKAQIWPFVTHHRPPDLGSDLRSSHPQISPNRPIRQINDHQAPSAAPIAASSVQGINRAA
ncbi:hypothetical protein ACLOJK_014841, partial [Asimina triloba]